MDKDIKNIAIMRTDRIGEVLLSTVAVDMIKKHYPGAGISFVVSDYAKPLLEDRNDLKEIITVDTTQKKGCVRRGIELGTLLRKRKIDAAIVLNPHKMLHLACVLGKIPYRVGYNRKWGFLLNRRIEDRRDKGEKHEIEYTMDVLRLLDIDPPAYAPRLFLNEKAIHVVEEMLLKENTDPRKPLIAVHPGSSNPAKLWPADLYARLIDKIKSEFDCTVCILGVKGEKDLIDRILQAVKAETVNLAGKLDLRELAGTIRTPTWWFLAFSIKLWTIFFSEGTVIMISSTKCFFIIARKSLILPRTGTPLTFPLILSSRNPTTLKPHQGILPVSCNTNSPNFSAPIIKIFIL
jgi:ADP-heptose:LPS heptosyltransferase